MDWEANRKEGKIQESTGNIEEILDSCYKECILCGWLIRAACNWLSSTMTHLKKITGSVYRSVAVPGNLGDLTNETCCPNLSVIRSSEKSGYKINQLGRICIACVKMFLGGES